MTMPEWGLLFALAMFFIGFLGMMIRRNIFFMLLAVEVMLNAANLAFVSASRLTNTMDGQVAVIFVMTVAACEAAVGLALVILLQRARGALETDDLRILRG